MAIQEIVNTLLVDLPALTTVLSSMLFGEEAVILLGFFSGLKLLPLWILFVFGFIGTLIADISWFIMGKTTFKQRKIEGSMHIHYNKFMNRINRTAMNNMFLALFFTRFFYFFRLFAIIHLSRNGMPWKRFLLYEIPLIAVWLAFFVAIGWLFGRVVIQYLDIIHNIEKVFIIIIVALAIFLLTKSFIRKKIEKKN